MQLLPAMTGDAVEWTVDWLLASHGSRRTVIMGRHNFQKLIRSALSSSAADGFSKQRLCSSPGSDFHAARSDSGPATRRIQVLHHKSSPFAQQVLSVYSRFISGNAVDSKVSGTDGYSLKHLSKQERGLIATHRCAAMHGPQHK